MVAGDALQPTDAATTVRVRDGERSSPTARSPRPRRWLGGYYLIDVPDLDEALDVGRQDPERRRRLDRGAAGHGGCPPRREPRPRGVERAFREEARARPRHADPPLRRRLRPRRGRAAGRVRRGARRPGRATACPERPAPGSPPPRGAARSTGCAASAARPAERLRGAGARCGAEDDEPRGAPDMRRRRPPAPDLHLLPPGARARGPRRADAAHARRADDAEIARGFLVQRGDDGRSGWCAPSARSPPPASPTRCRATTSCPTRLAGVLAVVYLVFNEGYVAAAGDRLVRDDLCAEAIRLGAPARELMPDDAEVAGLLALMLLHDARRDAASTPTAARPAGRPGPRALGRRPHRRGPRALDRALRLRPARALPAAGGDRRAARRAHAARPTGRRSPRSTARWPGWTRRRSSRSTAPSRSAWPAARAPASRSSTRSRPGLDDYQPLHAARAELLRRAGDHERRRRAPTRGRSSSATTTSSATGWPAGAPPEVRSRTDLL